MKQYQYIFVVLFLFPAKFIAQISNITRGPYIQNVTETSAVLHWRTANKEETRLIFSKKIGKKSKTITNKMVTHEHEILLTGLKPNTKYFYKISGLKKDKALDNSQFFKTNPIIGSEASYRIWALGDFGNSSPNQKKVKDAIVNFTKSKPIDAWIWLGDNAYSNGKDEEYQKHVFPIYQDDFFKNTTLYPSPGNHDYAGKHDSSLPPYFKIFTMPTRGEAGGVESGTESYYSVDFGNVHLVSLNTEELSSDSTYLFNPNGQQASWLKKDLAANKLKWTIVYFHKPPYSKGSHDSDKEDFMVKMRENVNPIFEQFNVDLVLAGHSHVYERTHPIRNHFGVNDTFSYQTHVFSNSKSTSDYVLKNNEKQGVIYIVNGSGGQIGGQYPGYPLNCAIYSNNKIGGSMIIDFEKNKLIAKWITADAEVADQFSITKE